MGLAASEAAQMGLPTKYAKPGRLTVINPSRLLAGDEKKAMAEALGLWFVDPRASPRPSVVPRWDEIIVWEDTHVGPNFTLPCPFGAVAWQSS